MAQAGQVRGRATEEDLVGLLKALGEREREEEEKKKIVFKRRGGGWDDEEDDF